MGCCVSTATKSTKESRETSVDQLAPPPPPLEEETVKEVVLSETTIPNSSPTNLHEHVHYKNGIQIQQRNVESTATTNIPTDPMVIIKPIEDENLVRASLNDRVSPAPVPEKFVVNDDELTKILMEEVPDKWKNSVKVSSGKERRRRSPARRPVEEKSQRQNPVQVLSSVSPVRCHRRDSGQAAGRRSKSPATFREADKGKNVIDMDLNFSEGGFFGDRWPEKSLDRNVELRGKFNGDVSVEDDSVESLENPLVSLECFIFL